jgi:hypothetical protein
LGGGHAARLVECFAVARGEPVSSIGGPKPVCM